MAIYLYCRISQRKQNIERQERNLLAAFPDGIIIREAFTGTTTARPAWTKVYLNAAAGDTIAFDSVSRMSRSAAEGVEIYEELYRRGVNLVFLKEPYINTDVYREKTKAQIDRISSTGSAATDKLLNTIIEALHAYAVDMAREQVQIAFDQAEKEVKDLQQRTKEGLQTARLNGKKLGSPRGKRETKKAKAAKAEIIKKSRDFSGSMTDRDLIKVLDINPHTFYKYKKELRAAAAAKAEEEVAAIVKAAAAPDR